MKRLIILLLLSCCLAAGAQQKDCSRYHKFMDSGKVYINAQNYEKALNQYLSAQIAARECGVKTEDATAEIKHIFTQIADLKTRAAERNKTKAALIIANKANQQAEIEKRRADVAQKQTNAALAKAQKLVDAFYFYDEKFALAFKNGAYYFIDKNGDPVDKLGQWNKGEQFDDTELAKVSDNKRNYLLDTTGKNYPLTTDIKQLDSSITALNISRQKLTTIPPLVFEQPQLEIFFANDNYLHALPKEIGNLKGLTELALYNNQLQTLPAEMGNLKSLTYLNLRGNAFKMLPAEIGNLKSLSYLDLSQDSLQTLPPEIGNLKSLTILDLSRNQFDTIPAEIGNLKNLTSLDLALNKLKTLPAQIGNLKSLTALYLGINRIPKAEILRIKKLLPKCKVYSDFDW